MKIKPRVFSFISLYFVIAVVNFAISIKDDLHVTGTCGNGLKCDSKSFYEVDCFTTLLTERCSYNVGTKTFIAFATLSLLLIMCVIITCLIYRRFGWKGLLCGCDKINNVRFLSKLSRKNKHVRMKCDQSIETHFDPIHLDT